MVWTVFLIPVVTIIAIFTFVSIATWVENRRKEREAYYRNETFQKMLDGSPESAETVHKLIREEEERLERRRRRGMKLGLLLGGLITTAVGLGLGVFLFFLVDDDPVYLVGIIPLLVGLVMTVFGASMSAPEATSSG